MTFYRSAIGLFINEMNFRQKEQELQKGEELGFTTRAEYLMMSREEEEEEGEEFVIDR